MRGNDNWLDDSKSLADFMIGGLFFVGVWCILPFMLVLFVHDGSYKVVVMDIEGKVEYTYETDARPGYWVDDMILTIREHSGKEVVYELSSGDSVELVKVEAEVE